MLHILSILLILIAIFRLVGNKIDSGKWKIFHHKTKLERHPLAEILLINQEGYLMLSIFLALMEIVSCLMP